MRQTEKIGMAVNKLSNEIRRSIDNSVAGSIPPQYSATAMHGRILGFLLTNGERELFQRDVETEFDIRRSTASQMLALMEKNGLVERESVTRDERLKRLVVTERGRVLFALITRAIDAVEERLSAGIPDEDIEAFFRVVSAISANLSESC